MEQTKKLELKPNSSESIESMLKLFTDMEPETFKKLYLECLESMIRLDSSSDLVLDQDNRVRLPQDLIDEIGLKPGDKLYADIFDEDLKQIAIGKKLSGPDAVKGMKYISELLKKE